VSRQTVDANEFRRTLGCFATGVTVVTAVGVDGEFVGVTVNSFNSLSLDPPLVLWSLDANSPLLQAFERASHFAVNVLAEDQIEISQRFALSAVDKFAQLKLSKGLGGGPQIAECMAWIECRNYSHHRYGDHLLFIGEVERLAETSKKPLLYLRGHYTGAGERVA